MSSDRLRLVDFSSAVESAELVLKSRHPQEVSATVAFVVPFDTTTWLLTSAFSLATAIALNKMGTALNCFNYR